MKKICKNCTHWKNEQSELDYNKFTGVCTCHKWKFTTTNESDCFLLDRENISEKHMGVQRFEYQNKEVPISARNPSRYCLVTREKFGCVHFENK